MRPGPHRHTALRRPGSATPHSRLPSPLSSPLGVTRAPSPSRKGPPLCSSYPRAQPCTHCSSQHCSDRPLRLPPATDTSHLGFGSLIDSGHPKRLILTPCSTLPEAFCADTGFLEQGACLRLSGKEAQLLRCRPIRQLGAAWGSRLQHSHLGTRKLGTASLQGRWVPSSRKKHLLLLAQVGRVSGREAWCLRWLRDPSPPTSWEASPVPICSPV